MRRAGARLTCLFYRRILTLCANANSKTLGKVFIVVGCALKRGSVLMRHQEQRQ